MRQGTLLKLKQLVLIVACYLIISFIISVYDHLVLHTDFSAGPRQGYSFSTEFSRNMIGGFCGAIFGGSFLIFFVNTKYQDKPYAYTIIAVSGAFIFIFTTVTIVMGITVAIMESRESLAHGYSKSFD